MDRELAKLIFGDVLDNEQLSKIINISNIGMNLQEEEDAESGSGQNGARRARKSSDSDDDSSNEQRFGTEKEKSDHYISDQELDEEDKSEDKPVPPSQQTDNKDQQNLTMPAEQMDISGIEKAPDEDEDMGIKSSDDSFQVSENGDEEVVEQENQAPEEENQKINDSNKMEIDVKKDLEVDEVEEEDEESDDSGSQDSAETENEKVQEEEHHQDIASKYQKLKSIQGYIKYEETKQQKNGIDLPVLIRTKNEIIYRLTDLYLPRTDQQKKKMNEYNVEKMGTQNDQENDAIRTRKRKLKEELKHIQLKLKYPMKYCNPNPLLEDVQYLYREGMNTRQIDGSIVSQSGQIVTRNKYSNAPHIGRILPQKRAATTSSSILGQSSNNQALIDQQRGAFMQQMQEKSGSQGNDNKIKNYTMSTDGIQDGLESENIITIWDNQVKALIDPKTPEEIERKEEELKYQQIMLKVSKQELSVSDLSYEERQIVKSRLHRVKDENLLSKYPLPRFSIVEKQCFAFMKNLNQDDFSYMGHPSALYSDDNMFLDDLMGGAGASHSHIGIGGGLFGSTNISDDKHSFISGNYFGQGDALANQNKGANNEISDSKLQEWILEQRYKQMKEQQQKHQILQNSQLTKRRKYWGEPTDCNTGKQLELDDYKYKVFKNKLFNLRGNQEEKLFKVDRIQLHQDKKDKLGQGGLLRSNAYLLNLEKAKEDANNLAVNNGQGITDINEYEYLRKQESYFYADLEKRTSVNSIMRNVKRQLGLISEQEFLEQEELEDKLEQQQNPAISSYSQRIPGVGSSMNREKSKDKAIEIEARKEKICSELIDNFDYHFEKRKKELHDGLLKKIQQHEKANQQTSTTQQTVAYASGSHALLQVQGAIDRSLQNEGNRDRIKSLVNMHRLREDQEAAWSEHNRNNTNMNPDEEMLELDTQAMRDQNQIQRAGQNQQEPEENMRLRVTKSRANELNHAKCILKLTFTRFDWGEKELMQFHRPNIQETIEKLLQGEQANLDETKKQRANAASRSGTQVQIDFGGLNKKGEQKASVQVNERLGNEVWNLPEQVNYISLNVNVVSQDQIERRIKKTGIINAHEYFKDRFKLSLRDGKFCIFEHIDQNPLFVNNFGMASKLKRYVYSDKILPPSAFLKRAENQTTRHMGPHGAQILKKKGERIPLLGQIDSRFYKGLTVMENNMFYCPLFYHKPQRNDFLCVFHRDKKGNNQILIREVQDLYIMGQEEPKQEVYNPQSRQYQHFIKRRTQAYVVRFLQENNNYISFAELNRFFPYINDQILKKIIKEINVEVDRNQFCSLTGEYNDEQFRALITPENVCQYESAQFGEHMLKKVGIRDITNADKISYATNKFCSEELDKKKQLIARVIEEEVLSTPWNLSQSFIHNRQQKGMMMLEGIGDPSNGNGGYSYLKLPLKISQDSLNKAKINRMYLNPAIQNPKAVTGTDADLRKLSKKEIKNKLIDLGFKEEDIQGFTRWEMVALLRDKSSQAVSQGMEGEMKKFARGVRFTSKKQREMYQKQVNDIFKKQIKYLSSESGDFISDMSDNEGRDEHRRKMNELQQMNNNYQKNIIEMKEDKEITKITQIPDYAILLMASQPISAMSTNPNPNNSGGINSGLGGSGTGSGMGLNIGGNSGLANSGIDLATGQYDLHAATEALKMKLKEGSMSLKCTILRKRIKPVSGEKNKIERVIFCSDPRQIKGFKKRKQKHDVKTKRIKKTSLNKKMQITKPLVESDYKDRKSETSSVIKQSQGRLEGGDTKIKIGMDQSMDMGGQSQRIVEASGPISINLSQVASLTPGSQPQKKGAQKKEFHRYSSQLQLAAKPLDQLSMSSTLTHQQQAQNYGQQDQQQQPSFDQQMTSSQVQIPQQPQKISIAMSMPQNQPSIQIAQPRIQDDYESQGSKIVLGMMPLNQQQQPSQPKLKTSITLGGLGNMSSGNLGNLGSLASLSSLSVKQEKKDKKQKKQQQPKFPSTYIEDEYDYKHKNLPNRRRQETPEVVLNRMFTDIIEACFIFDRSKIFHFPVKKKDAPNYTDIIKNPIDLQSMKNKAKRNEYDTSDQFIGDLELMRTNAEIYNGPQSQIAQLARDLVNFGAQKVQEQDQDIKSYELLVKEEKERRII